MDKIGPQHNQVINICVIIRYGCTFILVMELSGDAAYIRKVADEFICYHT